MSDASVKTSSIAALAFVLLVASTARAEIIDTWEMTITPVEDVFEVEPRDRYRCVNRGNRAISLPGRPYIALRIRKVA
jgi:hypothetical protein